MLVRLMKNKPLSIWLISIFSQVSGGVVAKIQKDKRS